MSYETVTFEVKDGIATMTLNRPKQLNCFNQTMFKEWSEVIGSCAYDDDIRVLVITGNGRAFSSGVDLTVLGSDKFDPAQFRFYYRQNHLGFDNLEALEKPVIAAINGLCYGGGVELALSCDILFAADDAKFCLIENHIGCIPASGACNRMIHYVGLAKTKEMVISGRADRRAGGAAHRPCQSRRAGKGSAEGSLCLCRQARRRRHRWRWAWASTSSIFASTPTCIPAATSSAWARACWCCPKITRKACRRSARSGSRSSRASKVQRLQRR